MAWDRENIAQASQKRKSDSARRLSRQSIGPTGRQAGAACVASGLPAERRTCNWCAASVLQFQRAFAGARPHGSGQVQKRRPAGFPRRLASSASSQRYHTPQNDSRTLTGRTQWGKRIGNAAFFSHSDLAGFLRAGQRSGNEVGLAEDAPLGGSSPSSAQQAASADRRGHDQQRGENQSAAGNASTPLRTTGKLGNMPPHRRPSSVVSAIIVGL